jgi:hypothetical protein
MNQTIIIESGHARPGDLKLSMYDVHIYLRLKPLISGAHMHINDFRLPVYCLRIITTAGPAKIQ